MLNMIDTQDKLKNFSEQQLIQEMQRPSGSAPQFMVLGEIERRKRMRADMQKQQGLMQPTVAQEAVSAAGVPQQGIAQVAQSLAPNTDMTQNTGVPSAQATRLPAQPNQPQRMAGGGVLRLAPGGGLSGGTISAIAQLKVKRPDVYEEYKDDPEMLAMVAEYFSFPATDPEKTGLESLEAPYVDPYGPQGLAQRTAAAEVGNQARMASEAAQQREIDRMLGINDPLGSGRRGAPLDAAARRRIADEDMAMAVPVPRDDFRSFPVATVDMPPQPGMPFELSKYSGVSRDGRTDAEILAKAQDMISARRTPESDALLAEIKKPRNYPKTGGAEVGNQAANTADSPFFNVPRFNPDSLQAAVDRDRELDRTSSPTTGGAEAASPTTGRPRAEGIASFGMFDPLVDIITGGIAGTPEERLMAMPVEAGDPTQAQITMLRRIIDDPKADTTARAAAAQELQALQNSIAVNQTGGNLAATAENGGLEIPEGYTMGAFGLMLDPNYRSPGKTGNSLIDQAALQGTEALTTLAQSGAVDPALANAAESIAKQADFERDIYPVNVEIAQLNAAANNPYLPADLKSGIASQITNLENQKSGLVTATGAAPLQAPNVDAAPQINTSPKVGGYTGLIDPDSQSSGVATKTAIADAQEEFDQRPDTQDVKPAAEQKRIDAALKTITDPAAMPPAATPRTGKKSGILAEKNKMDQDKWLALAQAGFTLMSTGDFGKAGSAGLAAYREGEKANREERKLDAELLLREAQLAKANRAPAAKPIPAAYLTSLQKDKEDIQEKLARLRPPVPAGKIYGAAQDPDAAARTLLTDKLAVVNARINRMYSQYGLGASVPSSRKIV